MVARETENRIYFAPPDPYFWRWNDAGQVICWSDGRTVAFRDELLQVLERLAADGLPPLGAIVLLLAACRANWTTQPARRVLLAEVLSHTDDETRHADLTLLNEVCTRLELLNRSLSDEDRASLRAKAELSEMVFGPARTRLKSFQSTSIVAGLQLGLMPEDLEPRPVDGSTAAVVLRRDLHCLLNGLERFDTGALALRMKTGLEQQILPAPVEIPAVGTARSLILNLRNDDKLGALARLATRLLSVVQWPRPLDALDDLPLGGVSDIANRGPLDRLLLSELAHDDLTLAARVANGEALYLRREVPPSTPPKRRLVLIDVGIRVWGVPRIFSTAVALALAAASRSELEVGSYRAEGAEIVPVDFRSEQGLVDHLSALDFRAHPGAALEPWENLCRSGDHGADTMLVTSEDVLDDPEFHRAVERFGLDEWYIITINRDGRFRQIRRTRIGGKLLREAQFSLAEVLEPQPVTLPLFDSRDAGALPAFLLQRPLPLLLTRELDYERSWHVKGQGALSITNDGRLLLWNHPGRGAQELAAGLPRGSLHACSSNDEDMQQALIGRLGRKGLYSLTIDLTGPRVECVSLQFDEDSPRGTFFHAGFAFVAFEKKVMAFDPQTGECCASQSIAPKSWRTGRYFKFKTPHHESYWAAASLSGGEIVFETIPLVGIRSDEVACIFDAVAMDGAIAVTRSGNIHFPNGEVKQIQQVKGQISVTAVSRDRNRILIQDALASPRDPKTRLLVFTLNGSSKPIGALDPRAAIEPAFGEYVRPRLVRCKFRGVAVDLQRRLTFDSQRRLTLISRQNRHWPFELQNDRFALAKQGLPPNPELHVVPFETVESWNGTPHEGLRIAKWGNGDQLILDSRGLLHCQAADRRVPEFTIVLCEGESAGWCNDGRCWGSQYYCRDRPTTPVSDIFSSVIGPFIEGLR